MYNQPKEGRGRYPKGHVREGGYCVLWARQTLSSEKLKNPLIAGCFFKVLCVAQLIDFETGIMAKSDMPISAITIANRAGITVEQLQKLVDLDLVTKTALNGEVVYTIKSWIEHQNPKIAKQEQNELLLKCKASGISHHSSGISHHSSDNLHKKRNYKNETIPNNGKDIHKPPITDVGF